MLDLSPPSQLSARHRTIMAALTCEKMQVLYEAFCELEEWGDPALYQQGIDALYSFGLDDSTAAAVHYLANTQHLSPDLDDFTTPLASYALDASSALTEALHFVVKQEEKYFHNHLAAVTDCIDMFVQMYLDLNPNRPDLDEIIRADEYMQQEHERRKRLYTALQNITHITPTVLVTLRNLNGTEPIVGLDRLAGL
ncbi:DUF416 family protein [Hymenobacter sp. YC55]|uniref:DUF416 family protein n=1 Tax=Hymenobacter sp. YC55 TaxID=3034019 RepID=UPI0023F6DB33|nr:DUF416 family protein [Hymenobacter sp. YC55]MDF7810021.1 DUF416 family protein [Hymenobacter sp. YC55]